MHRIIIYICGAAHAVPASTHYIVGLTYGHGSSRLAHLPVRAQLYII